MSIGVTRQVAVALTLGALMSGGRAWAQLGAGRPDGAALPETSPFQMGPVSFQPSILLHDVGVDDNVYNAWTNPREDFTSTLSPRLQATITPGSFRVVSTGSAGFVYFRTYKDQQALNGSGTIRVERLSGRLRPFGSAELWRVRERRGEDMDVRVRSVRRTATGGLDVQLTPVTALTTWVRRDQVRYQPDEEFLGVSLAHQLNNTSDVVAGGAKFAVTPLTTITTAAEYQRDRFQWNPVRDADSLRVAPTVDFDATAIVSGRASLGYRRFMPLDGRLPNFQGLVGSAVLTHTVASITRLDLQAERDIDYSYDPLQPFFVRSDVRLTVSQRVVGPLELIAIGGRRHVKYQALAGAAIDPRRETTGTIGGGLGIRVGTDMRFSVTYDRTRRQATGSGREYERRRVLASLTYLP